MTGNINSKPIPRSILIFGATGHIGGPLTGFLHREAPQIQLRLASSKPERVDNLRRDFPYAEVVHANYFDLPSLESAAQGMEGVFVITTNGTDERPAMTNLVGASRGSCATRHVVNESLGSPRFAGAASYRQSGQRPARTAAIAWRSRAPPSVRERAWLL